MQRARPFPPEKLELFRLCKIVCCLRFRVQFFAFRVRAHATDQTAAQGPAAPLAQSVTVQGPRVYSTQEDAHARYLHTEADGETDDEGHNEDERNVGHPVDRVLQVERDGHDDGRHRHPQHPAQQQRASPRLLHQGDLRAAGE